MRHFSECRQGCFAEMSWRYMCLTVLGEEMAKPLLSAIFKSYGYHVDCPPPVIPIGKPPGHAMLDLTLYHQGKYNEVSSEWQGQELNLPCQEWRGTEPGEAQDRQAQDQNFFPT